MIYFNAGQTAIPRLGLGTYKLQGATAAEIFAEAFALGIRHFDTAQFYDNEVEVGDAVKASGLPRNELFITTKVWYSNLAKKDFMPSVEESLRKLQMDQVDLLLIHWPNDTLPLAEYMEELMRAQQMGYTKHIGVSNFSPRLVQQALATGANLVNNQVEYHPFLNQDALLGVMRPNGMSLTAYSPVAQGKVKDNPVLQGIAAKYGKSTFQVTIRWFMQQDAVMAIPRTSSVKNLRNNFNVFDFELSRKG